MLVEFGDSILQIPEEGWCPLPNEGLRVSVQYDTK